MGGSSDGSRYMTTFQGVSLEASYGMVRAFLVEEGYGDVPLPATPEELLLFRVSHSKSGQTLLFEDNGYCHNPIKILFPLPSRHKNTLHLMIYNEQAEGHLLRFHGKRD